MKAIFLGLMAVSLVCASALACSRRKSRSDAARSRWEARFPGPLGGSAAWRKCRLRCGRSPPSGLRHSSWQRRDCRS